MTSRGRSRRPLAIAAGVALAVALFFSPVAPALARLTPPTSGATQSSRQLYYAGSKDSLRDSATYLRARSGAPAGNKDLVLMGSSEMSSPAPQNPSRFLQQKVSDFDVYMDGRGYTQSLYHAIELAAISDQLSPPRVALIVSPQWFAAGGASAESFREVFSAEQFQGMLDSPKISPATKEQLFRRASTLLGDSAWSGSASGRRAMIMNSINAIPSVIQRRADVLKVGWNAAVATGQVTGPYQSGSGAVPVAQINWAEERSAAEKMGAAAVTNNDFAVADSYYDTYIRAKVQDYKNQFAGTDYAADSPEWDDLSLFLRVARETGTEVLLVGVPMNGRWYDYTGYTAERRSRYYARLSALAKASGVGFADLSTHEYEPYFLFDIMHLGWKGWLDVTEACVRFAHS